MESQMTQTPLDEWGTEELERWLESGSFKLEDQHRAKRILRERNSKPDRRIAIWTLRFAAVAALAGVIALFR
jgi:hypothetical protein